MPDLESNEQNWQIKRLKSNTCSGISGEKQALSANLEEGGYGRCAALRRIYSMRV